MTNIDVLSPMERQVMEILADGYTVAETAKKLAKGTSTIDTHLHRVKRKLSARSARHAVMVFARQLWLEQLTEGT